MNSPPPTIANSQPTYTTGYGNGAIIRNSPIAIRTSDMTSSDSLTRTMKYSYTTGDITIRDAHIKGYEVGRFA